jgi:hypothetical protein
MANGEFVQFTVGAADFSAEVLVEMDGLAFDGVGTIRAVAAYGRRSDGLRMGAVYTGQGDKPDDGNRFVSAVATQHRGNRETGAGRFLDTVEAGVQTGDAHTILVNAGDGSITEILAQLDTSLEELATRVGAISA